jgi:hypothetical protein
VFLPYRIAQTTGNCLCLWKFLRGDGLIEADGAIPTTVRLTRQALSAR